ncbi:MAG: cation:dicarboxylase symporter family transporter, partial [Sphingomonadaceae bacterium]|nr:cation:dicarboxylase symporter family transporter [Sphingomonadaceae bacterium]
MQHVSRILIALVAGLLLGIACAAFAPAFVDPSASVVEPVGALWLNGLRMTIIPLVVA